ncbi:MULTISPECIES: four-carbon acid sugar kinase family protein [unclassified Mesorhizobium]|uniref:four-carbon acid sugar kinase family protein n=1 Tax=unclassified Mesorhizobium TaxID=325217 RepID=UPI000FEA5E86|nr:MULTISPECIES: four-carbon acid sugar kinase family protein [unclassified Mesorhizobium]RWI29457.1 MAG: hypothetical protein EOQ92_03600 [Mesorhizobium sp.]RWK52419.1 MAG: hypothetical protein EOR47_03180 [Mesorhizobium sp.]RWK97481.1 MAG: hypothetical protein EOR53_05015 [Mesorhizobium sp.]RWL14181.1 MAG: hypothetical protein EOR45_01335 [Mesorhizobium sp.]TIP60010.1 MAG: four-carbon acid sugar kinase family protein [Mesorhizobium sp.]
MLLGAIADDLTGATDLALMLSRGGMRALQTIGTPPSFPKKRNCATRFARFPPRFSSAASRQAPPAISAPACRTAPP